MPSYMIGNHTLKFGGEFLRDTVDSVLTGQVNGTVSFQTPAAFSTECSFQGPGAHGSVLCSGNHAAYNERANFRWVFSGRLEGDSRPDRELGPALRVCKRFPPRLTGKLQTCRF